MYGNFLSGRFYVKKRDVLFFLEGAAVIVIVLFFIIILVILVINYVFLNDKGFLNFYWVNVVFRFWNFFFIGVYLYVDEIVKIKYLVDVIVIIYWIFVLFLLVLFWIGYLIGVLEKKEFIKFFEYIFLFKKKS